MRRHDVRVELLLGSQWADVTEDVLAPGGEMVRITRGRADESARVTPSRLGLSLRNTGGRYSPRNPMSDLYGLIGRNTPIRVYVGRAPVGAATVVTTAPSPTSHVAPSVTASAAGLLVSTWVATTDPAGSAGTYTPPGGMTERSDTATSRSTLAVATQQVGAGATGTRTATYSTAGTVASWAAASIVLHGPAVVVEESLAAPGNSPGANLVTLTTSVATDVGWWLVAIQAHRRDTLGTSPAAPSGGGWELLTDSVVEAAPAPRLKIWARRVRYYGAQTVTFAPSVPGEGHNAAVLVLSGVDQYLPRIVAEVSSWPPRWDVATHVWTPIEAQGILRRLGQGASPLRSAIYRTVTGRRWRGLVVAYWPCEDGQASQQVASGLSGSPMTVTGPVQFGSLDEVPGSDPLPVMGAGASLSGLVTPYTPSVRATLHAVISVPSAGITNGAVLLSLHATGTAARWDLVYGTGGTLRLAAYNGSGGLLGQTDPALAVNGWRALITVQLEQVGGNVNTVVSAIGIAAHGTQETDLGFWVQDIAGSSYGTVTRVVVAPGGQLDGVAVGHVTVVAETAAVRTLDGLLTGFAGERAGDRMLRLSYEEQVPLLLDGDPAATLPMGPQRSATLLDLLRECEEVDGGILYEPREQLALAYRTAGATYNQTAALTVPYSSPGLARPLEPVDDDQHTRNDVTAQRVNGSSAQVVVDEGPLSVQAPPAGVGRYETEAVVNVAADAQLADQAGWRAHLGTWDETRYPVVRFNLTADETLIPDAAGLDIRDRLQIDNPPVWLPPGPIDLLANGSTEELDGYVWDMRFTCTPAGPWQVATVDGDQRVPADGSTLAAGITADDMTLSLASTAANGVWVTGDPVSNPVDFRLLMRVGAELVYVDSITGTTSPQTVTLLARGLTGVRRAWPAGTPVDVWDPAVLPL